ncbi:MAG: SBBP repeat-containing protein, partial [Bacteroidia bacterium]
MKKVITLTLLLKFILITNAQNFEWAKKMGGNMEDIGHAITVDSNGNVYTTGTFDGTANFDPGLNSYNLTSYGSFDIFISKLDSNGNFLWATNFGGIDFDRGLSIAVDGDGNVYTTGVYQGTVDFDPGSGTYNLISSSSWNGDIFLSKLDANGNFIWAKSIGGISSETTTTLVLDSYSNIYITGSFWGTVDFDPGLLIYNLTATTNNGDIFISKLDSSGNLQWAKQLSGMAYNTGYSIDVDANGNVYTTGSFAGTVDFDPTPGIYNLSSFGAVDIFISKLDSSGNFIWANHMGGTDADFGYSIAVDGSGNIYTLGTFKGTIDLDPGIGIYNLNSFGYADIFISKFDTTGNFLWGKQIGGISNDIVNSMTIDTIGNIYFIGWFGGIVDFDPGPLTYNLSSAGAADIFVTKLDSNGNLFWAQTFGGSASDIGFSIDVDKAGSILTTGWFSDTVDFDNGPGIYNLISAGQLDVFINKISQCAPPTLSMSIIGQNLCHGDSLVSAYVTATGNAPFIYNWSNGQTTHIATGLPAGTHIVTVTDDSSCAAIATINITEPAQIISNISSIATNYTSPNCNGSVSINLTTGGTPPYA